MPQETRRSRNAGFPVTRNRFCGLLFDRNILVDVLRTYQRVEEHVGQTSDNHPVAREVTCEVGHAALDQREDTAAANHHHEDTRTHRGILAKAFDREAAANGDSKNIQAGRYKLKTQLPAKLALAKQDSGDTFYVAKLHTARFYFAKLFPEVQTLMRTARAGSKVLMDTDAALA